MSIIATSQESELNESQREITSGNELFNTKLADSSRVFRETHRLINLLKAKTANKEYLELLEMIDKNTILLFDSYISVLQIIISNNHREFKLMIDNITNVINHDK